MIDNELKDKAIPFAVFLSIFSVLFAFLFNIGGEGNILTFFLIFFYFFLLFSSGLLFLIAYILGLLSFLSLIIDFLLFPFELVRRFVEKLLP